MESIVPKRQVLDDDDGLYESSKGRSPEKALEEIRKQDTHDLYCPKCTSNITKTALIVEKGDDFSPDDQKPFVLWIPTFKFLSSSPKGSVESKPLNPNLSGPDEENSSQPESSEPVDKNSSFNRSLSSLAKTLERLPTLLRNSIIIRRDENSATPLHQDGAGHQSSTSTSVSEQRGRWKISPGGWIIHR
ncbi:hypothetical protein AT4G27845 [Arabidopsis thaliana]|uniref:Uncharacterized protein n=1 Tax=Arabidopsis thaliana TaxID=3702 RepID=A0A1P8B5J9_ARATH|nr:uncharacterized protein AT4G27845 [Arabidopsis thaliana]ANM66861.1 hypothetical protein AT4G27845 [Arabidopsis thaliana]|eukprot:NP_001328730.1 hypothetical protein AT4G27845 [Arabidopsis thaliana]